MRAFGVKTGENSKVLYFEFAAEAQRITDTRVTHTMPETAKRIAAIDVGTNSVHMIVAETNGHGYKVIDREKEMVQLGLSSLDGQPLTDQAMERGVATLKRMADLAKRWKADDIVAVATS